MWPFPFHASSVGTRITRVDSEKRLTTSLLIQTSIGGPLQYHRQGDGASSGARRHVRGGGANALLGPTAPAYHDEETDCSSRESAHTLTSRHGGRHAHRRRGHR